MEIKRDSYLEQLISYRFDGLVKVITGIRRCGKSYLLKNIGSITNFVGFRIPFITPSAHVK